MGRRRSTRSSWTAAWAFMAERYFEPAEVERLIATLTRLMAGVEGRHEPRGPAHRDREGASRRDRRDGRHHQGPGARARRLPAPARRARREPVLEVRRDGGQSLARPRRGLRQPEAAVSLAFGRPRRYDAIFFDLFDTLVHFDRERLPQIDVDGRSIRSTAGCLHALLQPHAPSVSLAQCYVALVASWKEAERLRAIDHREVSAPERFRDFFDRLALEHATLAPDLAAVLIEAHRAELSKAASFPPHYGPLLRRLAKDYRLAVVSNFDYTPTAIGILEAAGVLDLFAAVIVSDAVGWRKPRPDIFRRALDATGADPAHTLFVGDRADIDVEGAHRVGMDAAWINPDREPLPEGVTPPEYEIRDLADLAPILGLT